MPEVNSLPYKALYELALSLYQQDMDVRKVMQMLLVKTGEISGLKQGFLITFNKDDTVRGAYILAGSSDDPAQNVDNRAELWETLLSRGLIGFVYHGERTVIIRNLKTDSRWPALPKDLGLPEEGSAIGIPLQRGMSVFGVMMFLHPQVDFFSGHIQQLLEEIARVGARAINNAWDFDISGKGSIRYQTLFNDAVVPMILTDLNGSIVSVNRKACDMLDYDQHQLLLKSITTINRIELEKIGTGGLDKLRQEEETTFRTEAITANGEHVPVLLRLRRLSISSGNLVEWVQQDVSAQMELEQLRRDLSAMVYHDLRNPLQGISASIQKLAQVLANHENPAVRTLLQIGNRSSRQLRRMIDSLLDVQRLEEGSAILDRNPIEMRVILVDAVQIVQPLAIENGQKIRFEVDSSLPLVSIDSDMVVRVIINLMENAIKYTPTNGEIIVKAMVDGNRVRISVRDSGPGIPAEYKHGIFDKFNRIKYRDAPQGVGLGLAFCRLAVQAHGGDIWVESEPGSGSEFIFTIPLQHAGDTGNDDLLAELVSTAS